MALGVSVSSETADAIKLASDSLEGNMQDDNAAWVLNGNVQLQHGERTMRADRMTVTREESKVVHVLAEGNPVEFRQNEPNSLTAVSSSMRYNVEEQTLVLTGSVELLQSGNQVRGERVQYDLKRGELIAGSASAETDQQIEFVLDTTE